jgi:hypothetical protein
MPPIAFRQVRKRDCIPRAHCGQRGLSFGLGVFVISSSAETQARFRPARMIRLDRPRNSSIAFPAGLPKDTPVANEIDAKAERFCLDQLQIDPRIQGREGLNRARVRNCHSILAGPRLGRVRFNDVQFWPRISRSRLPSSSSLFGTARRPSKILRSDLSRR